MLCQVVIHIMVFGFSSSYFILWLQLLAGNSLRHNLTSLSQIQAHSLHMQSAARLSELLDPPAGAASLGSCTAQDTLSKLDVLHRRVQSCLHANDGCV